MSSDNDLSSYYRNNLAYLFESADPDNPPVYNVDTLLFSYSTQVTFNNNVIPSSFFNNVSGVRFLKEEYNDVQVRANSSDGNKHPPALPTTTNFTDIAPNNEVKTEISRNNPMRSSIIKGIADEISFITNFESQALRLKNNDITTSHIAFEQYMMSILTSVCSQCFTDALQTASANIPPNAPIALTDAINAISYQLSLSKKKQLFTVVVAQAHKSLESIILPLTVISPDIMNDFNNTEGSFSRTLYYQLRTSMINELVISKSIVPDQEDYVLIYIKKIVTDIFIRSCYPQIHYLFIDAMMKRYAKIGDYVNIRLALLAKVFYIFYFVDYIYQNIYLPDNSLSSDDKALYSQTIDKIKTKLNDYLTSLNNIDITSKPGQNALANIITSLHTLSGDVVDKSQKIDFIKKNIVDNQQALRNIIANVDISRDRYNYQFTEFWIVLSILLILVIGSAILLFLNMPQYVFYIAGSVLVVVLVIKIVQMINYFITKN
jgi:hypothetical protein